MNILDDIAFTLSMEKADKIEALVVECTMNCAFEELDTIEIDYHPGYTAVMCGGKEYGRVKHFDFMTLSPF